jgi:hypothetical protein
LEIKPVDLSELAGVVLGCSIPLIVTIGIMVRVCLKPVVEGLARLRDGDVRRLEDRVARLEGRIEMDRDPALLESGAVLTRVPHSTEAA